MALPVLLAPAHYTSWMPFEAQETASGLSIACRNTPRIAIAVHAGFIAMGFCGFGWLTYAKAPDWFWATLALGTLTLGGFLTHTIWFHRAERQRGPVLVYDSQKGTIGLPRESRVFRVEEVDCIWLVEGHAAGEPVCQLQLHSRLGDRIALVSGYHGSLDQMLDMIATTVPIPTRRCTER